MFGRGTAGCRACKGCGGVWGRAIGTGGQGRAGAVGELEAFRSGPQSIGGKSSVSPCPKGPQIGTQKGQLFMHVTAGGYSALSLVRK